MSLVFICAENCFGWRDQNRNQLYKQKINIVEAAGKCSSMSQCMLNFRLGELKSIFKVINLFFLLKFAIGH